MATRIVEWKKPYTWWEAINIDENKVISLRLRDENNLIIYDSWDDEIYVDLQLPDWLEPTDAFPVWITTGRVLVADDWDKTWTIVIAKTTSWDYIQLLYADDGTLWMDNWTGTFKQILFKWDIDTLVTNLTNYIDSQLADKQDLTVIDSTTPDNPSEWLLWYDTSNNTLKIYDGTTWKTAWWWGWWSWDVVWPNSATDWNLAVFDGSTWKVIKDWWAIPEWVPSGWTDWQVLTQTQNWPSWENPTWWDTIEYVTQAEYTALLPWANTLAYYPLDSTNTVNDMKGSGTAFNLTNNWSVTFWTTAWVDCATFSWSNYLEYSSYSPSWMSEFTISCWTRVTNASSRWVFFIWKSNTSLECMAIIYNNEWSPNWLCAPYNIWAWWQSASRDVWTHLVCVYSSGTYNLYVNGVAWNSYSWTVELDSWVIRVWYGATNENKHYWQISEVIIENKAWTGQEISDYFDLTKADYWIS